MQPESVIIYERVLKGEHWPKNYIGTATSYGRTVEILKYVFFEKFGIKDYDTAKKVLTREFIKQNKLKPVIRKVARPPEILSDEYEHILWILFPERRKGKRALIIKVYSDVLSGRRSCFPRGYFVDPQEGRYRADTCVKHLCQKILHLSGEKIAKEFSHSNGIKTLSRYKLKIVLSTAYLSLSDMMYQVYPHLCSDLVYYQTQQDKRRHPKEEDKQK